jgi:response regulator RpfG family c-di-GMP phosphodiesterase
MKSGTLQILVVDDERPIRRFLRTALSAEGYQVVDVATGEDAIATVTRQTPDPHDSPHTKIRDRRASYAKTQSHYQRGANNLVHERSV